MAGLENLVSLIYHEKQQQGSMLCAQHALNSLLQGNYFTPPDLSDIARTLDALEHSYSNIDAAASHNMDDTGFFSIQVLENALKVWGLNLTRWRGEEMKQYQDHPHTQLAFILNLEQHWFTLRRFGHAEPVLDLDEGNGHWFNLNSFLSEPEWVGKLYLGMVLQQAETEGYSVFAVTQADPSAPLQLPRTEADEVASTLPEPRSAAHPGSQTSADRPLASGSSYTQNRPAAIEGLEDEDYELQAALQASLAGGHGGHDAFVPSLIPPRTSVPLPLEDDESPIHSSRSDTGAHSLTDDSQSSAHTGQDHPDKGLDPVEASLQRNKLMLQRMRAEQEYAQRELWGEGTSAEDVAALEARRAERQRQEEEEAEHLRRAIEESEALARIEGHMPHDDGDEGMDIEGVDVAPEGMRQQAPSARDISNRVYDDDDAELQAALKASLEQVPQGWEFPELARTYPHLLSSNPPSATSHSKHDRDMEDAESILSTEVEDHISSDAAAEAVSVDELRRRRLARFGI